MSNTLKKFAASNVAPLIILGLGSSLRVKFLNDDRVERARSLGPGGVIYAFWHECMLGLSYTHRRQGICILISRHSDGEYIARATARLGFTSARGSSSSAGAMGISGMVRAAERGHDLAMTPDGPRGPRHVVKPGTIHLSARTGLPIIPVSVDANWAIRLNSWDRFLVPLPLSRFVVAFGDPIRIPENLDKTTTDRLCDDLGTRLVELGEVVAGEIGR
jgi:lysophospholipid acyltransferase (LPLAT)-like uncharacterized protein